ncbi:unnamed protein product [Linum trigynum]
MGMEESTHDNTVLESCSMEKVAKTDQMNRSQGKDVETPTPSLKDGHVGKAREENQGKKTQNGNNLKKENQKSSPLIPISKKKDGLSSHKNLQEPNSKSLVGWDQENKAVVPGHPKPKGNLSPTSILKYGQQGKERGETKEHGASTGHQPKMKTEINCKLVKAPDKPHPVTESGRSAQKKSVASPKKDVACAKLENVKDLCTKTGCSDPGENATAMAVDDC